MQLVQLILVQNVLITTVVDVMLISTLVTGKWTVVSMTSSAQYETEDFTWISKSACIKTHADIEIQVKPLSRI